MVGRLDRKQRGEVGRDTPSLGLPAGVRLCRLDILVIDDEVPVLRSMCRRLRPHRVNVAAGAVEAFAELEQHAFDVILCDLNMPGVRGIGVYEYLQRLYPGEETRVIFMTGQILQPGAYAYLAALNNPVLVKPASDAELRAALASVLRAPTTAAPPRRRASGS